MDSTQWNFVIDKLWHQESKAIKFIEQYYAQELNKPRLKIILEEQITSSHYRMETEEIVIAKENLLKFVQEYKSVAFKLFYSLMIHEIGHAIYTPLGLLNSYTPYLNVLEDNRLEFHIALWNKRVRFNLLSYIFQDTNLNDDISVYRSKENPVAICLGLLRTIDNTKYVEFYNKISKEKVKKILELNDKYTMVKTKAIDLDSNEITKLVDISKEVEYLCKELATEMVSTNPPPPQKQKGKSKGANSNTQNGKDNIEETESSKLEQEKREAEQENEKIVSEIANGHGVLINNTYNENSYNKIDVKAFETLRNAGIKGKGKTERHSGTAKELSLLNYSRRSFVKNIKPFHRNDNVNSRGGKTSSILFYLDISGSMSGAKVKVATDYLKSFYDSMNSHLNIRFFAFGRNTYEMTRKELAYDFIENKLEGSTNPQMLKPQRNEHIVLLTDGQFNRQIPSEYMRKVNLVLIGSNLKQFFQEQGCMSITEVDLDHIKEGLDKATNFIKKVLN
jgi:Mg-chelatase subunit ChlD